ncbi:hypothetical protein CcI49_28745 [Frankia sp. CcI49]|uniref:AMP-binding protein n=1 Tax=Frankia sp. CcI49 TaxID=1745382 RepID=UPI0009774C09|nr:AMP-binding protein [Frankia sp. CcI49]ONH55593.1 hypothetical protein CcI49_28745 [Frankia sp. CcI49]
MPENPPAEGRPVPPPWPADPRFDLLCGTIPAALLRTAERFPDVEATVDATARRTYRQLADDALDAVSAMSALGVRAGDRVAVWGPNTAGWVLAALGAQGAGAALLPLNTRYTGYEVLDILRRAAPRLLLVTPEVAGRDLLADLAGAGPLPPCVEAVVVLGGATRPGHVSWNDLLAGVPTGGRAVARGRIARVGPDDISDIMFTSGTTGRSRGVVSRHGQSLRAHGYLGMLLGLAPGERYLVIPPFFHSFGYKAGWMACLVHGATMLPVERYDADEVLHAVERERITVLSGPPTLFVDLFAAAARSAFDLSSLRATIPSAAKVPAELIHRLHRDLGFETVLSGYGLTEATALVTSCLPGDAAEDVAGTVGRPVPGVEISLVGPDGGQVPPGEAGELLVRGYVVSPGRWVDASPDAPAALPPVADADGWLHTGDVAIRDERGYVRIVDRLTDMYVSGGFNVYPAEVELVLSGHSAVVAAAVVGVPDVRLGEVGVAYVVPGTADSTEGLETELVGWLRERVAHYKVPREVRIVPSLPRTAMMKIRKNVLRDAERARRPPAGDI